MFDNYDFKAFNEKELLITLIFESTPEDALTLLELNGDVWTAISLFCLSSSKGLGFKDVFGIDYLQCDWREDDKVEYFQLNHPDQTVYDTYNLFTVKDYRALELLDLCKIEYEKFGSIE